MGAYDSGAIGDLNEPRNVTESRSFIGLCNAFRRFIPKFARIADPLKEKIRTNQPQTIGDLIDEKNALTTIRERLISPPILALSRAKG